MCSVRYTYMYICWQSLLYVHEPTGPYVHRCLSIRAYKCTLYTNATELCIRTKRKLFVLIDRTQSLD